MIEKDQLYQNAQKTAQELFSQTGKQPGGPTGHCAPFMGGVISGEKPNFREYGKPSYLEDELNRLGIIRFPIDHASDQPERFVSEILPKKALDVDAIIFEGLTHDGYGHMVAVVPTDEVVDGESVREYHIVNSLVTGGVITFTDPMEAEAHVRDTIPREIKATVKLADDELKNRGFDQGEREIYETVDIGKDAYITVPIRRDDPRFYPEVVTIEQTLDQDLAALTHVLHAVVDDYHDIPFQPMYKHFLYAGLATVAARYGVRYPLLDELVPDFEQVDRMHNLAATSGNDGGKTTAEALADEPVDHTTYESLPTDDGLFQLQLDRKTLRAARRLIALYAQDQAHDRTLPTINTDNQLRFLNRQLELKDDLADPETYRPQTFTPIELEAAQQQVMDEIEMLQFEKVDHLEVVRLEKEGVDRYVFGSKSKPRKSILPWGKKEKSTYGTFSMDVPIGQPAPNVYGRTEDSHELGFLVDGNGQAVEALNVSDSTTVRTRFLSMREVHLTDSVATLHAAMGHMGDVHFTNASNFTAEYVQVNRLIASSGNPSEMLGEHGGVQMDKFISWIRTQYPHIVCNNSDIGAIEANGILFAGYNTDIGSVSITGGNFTTEYSDVENLHTKGGDAEVYIQNGSCQNLESDSDTDSLHFTNFPDANPGSEFFVDNTHVTVDEDGVWHVTSEAYDRLNNSSEHHHDWDEPEVTTGDMALHEKKRTSGDPFIRRKKHGK